MTKRAQRTYRDPIKYTIGPGPDDVLTQARYDELFDKVTEWFSEWRTTKAPASDVRLRIKCCLEGTTLAGEKWFSHWNSSFATRMKMLCRFDVNKMQPIRSASEKYKQKAVVSKRRAAEQKLNSGDPLIPDETRAELRKNVAYGDNPAMLLTKAEHVRWNELKEAYLKQFPELSSVASQAELDLLCDLQIQQERQRLKLLRPDKPSLNEGALLDLTKSVVELKKALGIHPDQLAKRVQQDQEGSVADAVRKLGSVDRARELRDRFFLEEMLMLYKMYHTPSPNPDSGGFQLDDVRLFAHTKCRTCACSSCGTRNFVGLNVEEVEAYLVENEVLTEVVEADVEEQ